MNTTTIQLAGQPATLGAGDNHILTVADPGLTTDDYLIFTGTDGQKGWSSAEVRTDLGLVIGTNVQAFDADLTAIAALTTTTYGRSLLELADASAGRTALGLTFAAHDPTDPTGTTATVDWSEGNFADIDTSSATGAVALTLSNPPTGITLYLRVTTGGTERDLEFPSGTTQSLSGGTTWSPSAASTVDIITIIYDGLNYAILGTSANHG